MRFPVSSISSLSLVALSTVALMGAATTAHAQAITGAALIGQATFDASSPLRVSTHTNGANVATTVGGLSGLARDAVRGVYYAISDDRGNLPRGTENVDPRFYTLGINTLRTNGSGQAVFGNQDVTFHSYTTLLRPNGTPYPFQETPTASDVDLDPEDIALSADGTGVYVVSEGDKNRSTSSLIIPAAINRYALGTGLQTDSLAVPAAYQNTASTNTTTGPRNNLSFESLAISGNTLLTGTENALQQDGPINSAAGGTFSRLLSYNLLTGQPANEYRYNLDAVAQAPTGTNFATAGLCDLLALGDGNFLALERSFTIGGTLGGGLKGDGTTAAATGYSVKLFQFNVNGVANGGTVNKQLVLDLNTLGIALDNIEGMEFGATFADGSRSLLLLSDDNFAAANGNGLGSAGQFTQFISLRVTQGAAAPEPGAVALLGATLPLVGGVALRRRRRSH